MQIQQKLLIRAKEESKKDEDLLILTVIASLLATFGILLDNQFLVIGAMLIAPFIDPIISIMVFFVFGSLKDALSSVITLFLMLFLGLCSSIVSYYFLTFVNPEATHVAEYFVGIENFVIAFLLGVVGALMWLWPKTSNTTAGLSIAISLVPPLSNLALSIVGQSELQMLPSLGTLLLNVVGLLSASFIVLLIKKRR